MPEVTTTIEQIDDTSAARTRIREHELVTDRPVEKGGGNRGPMGGELFVELTAAQSSLPLDLRAPDGAARAPALVPSGSSLAATYTSPPKKAMPRRPRSQPRPCQSMSPVFQSTTW